MTNTTKKRWLHVLTIMMMVMILFGSLPTLALDGIAEAEETEVEVMTPAASVMDSLPPEATMVHEIEARREENVKHFQLPDGSVEAVVYNRPVHRKDASGVWQNIDNRLSSVNLQAYATDDLRTVFSKHFTPNEPIFLLQENGYALSMSLQSEPLSMGTAVLIPGISTTTVTNAEDREEVNGWNTVDEARQVENESSILYTNVANNTDLEYILVDNDIKENIIVKAPRSQYVYEFELNTEGLAAVLNENGSVSLNDAESGAHVYLIPAPFMYDAEGNESNAVSYTLRADGAGAYTLTVTADPEWINAEERVFPVTIDPTVSNNSMFDTYIDESAPTSEFSTSNYLLVGLEQTAYIRSMTYPTLPEGATLLDAYLHVAYYYPSTGGNMVGVEAYRVGSFWNPSALTWNAANTSPYPGLLLDDDTLDVKVFNQTNARESNPQWETLDITDAAEAWYNEDAGRYGIALLFSAGGPGAVRIKSCEAESDYRAYFSYHYEMPRLADGVYKLKHAGGLYADVKYGGKVSGTPLHLYTGSTGLNVGQMFKITYITTFDGENYYTIRTMVNNQQSLYVDEDGYVVTNDISTLDEWGEYGTDFLWRIIEEGDSYIFENNLPGLSYGALSAFRSSQTTVETSLCISDDVIGYNHSWTLEPYTGGELNGIFWIDSDDSLPVGDTYTYEACMYSSVIGRNGPVEYSVESIDGNETDKATIDSSSGFFTTLKAGIIHLYCSFEDVPNVDFLPVTITIPNSIYIEFSYDDGFIQRNKTEFESDEEAQERISENILGEFFPTVAQAFEEMCGLHLISNQTVVPNYTSAADNCPNSGINSNCECIPNDECVLTYSDNPGENNSVSGYENESHCKSITRLRNDLFPGLPENTIRVTYTGHKVCFTSDDHSYNTVGLADYVHPIVCINVPQGSEEEQQARSISVLAHELTHLFDISHHDPIEGTTCVMHDSTSINVNNSSTYWCTDCRNKIINNRNRFSS